MGGVGRQERAVHGHVLTVDDSAEIRRRAGDRVGGALREVELHLEIARNFADIALALRRRHHDLIEQDFAATGGRAGQLRGRRNERCISRRRDIAFDLREG